MRPLIFAAVMFGYTSQGTCDTFEPSIPRVFVSDFRGSAIFTVIPPKHDSEGKITRPASGIAYQLGEDGKLKELYRTKGWYSSQVFISIDGHYLARVEPTQVGDALSPKHLALVFYHDGKPLQSYSTADLVLNSNKLLISGSHYYWLANEPQLELRYDYRFTLITADGLDYLFDVTTGKKVNRPFDP